MVYEPTSDNNWHPKDPTKGAIQWKGTGNPIGNKWKYKTKEDFINEYKNLPANSSIKKYDTNGRILFWDAPVGGTYGTIFQRYRAEYIEKIYLPASGGGGAFQAARRNSQGGW